MLKISFLGCSWTHGHNLPYTSTYPFIVHDNLNKSNIENQVINAGREGASWFNYPDNLKYIHKKYNPDLYVIQHTTPDRGMLLWCSDKAKYQNISRDHDIYDNYIQLWDNTQSYYHLTVGMAERMIADEQSELINHMFTEIQRKSSLKKDEIISRIKYWLEQERLHPLMFNKYNETIDYCDMYVKKINKKVLHIFWLNDLFVPDNLDDKLIIEKEIDFKEYVVDNGYHFDKQGNSKVADLILRECRLDNKSNTFWPVF
jgi:hypothetical protein